MTHGASPSSVRIAGVLILVWIGFYWARSPAGEPSALDPSPDGNADRSPTRPSSGLLPHERGELPPQGEADPVQLLPTPNPDADRRSPDPEPESGPVEADRTYIVRDGDTLGDIAIREYGSILFADLIFQANRDQLNSPHDLDLGMTLRLPPKP